MKNDFKKLEVGQEILVDTSDLPRVIEMIPAVGKEGDEDYVGAHEGEVAELSLNKPMTVTIVSLATAPGKDVGIHLANPPKGTRWYDAHECDGDTDKGFGWFISLEDVKQANPELFPDSE
jgi:hypothetical protein